MEKKKVHDYLEKLEKGIEDYMKMPASERSASALVGMLECYDHVKALACEHDEAKAFDRETAVEWVSAMENDDGTSGEHWTMKETTAVGESLGMTFDHITPYCWYAAMNMMHSDYCAVARKYGVDTPDFYADMAKAFLFDKDAGSPKQKLAAYYSFVVPHDEDDD